MLAIKPGAKIKGIQPEILLGISICQGVFKNYGVELIITEATASKHMPGSRHYIGLAVDIRSKHISTDTIKYKILEDACRALGDDFDIILENLGKDNEHFHLEFDPQ